MADKFDLEELHSGSRDLSATDLKRAKLNGLELRERDFSRAKLHEADLSGSDCSRSTFTGAETVNMNAADATFEEANFQSTGLLHVNFKGSYFRGANFRFATIANCNFSEADLRGATLDRCSFMETSNFEKCLVDETTDFEDASIHRPLARDPAFRYFKVVNGRLKRKSPEELAGVVNDPGSGARRDLERASIDLVSALAQIAPADKSAAPSMPGPGHNNPPEELPLEKPDFDALLRAVNDAKVEIPKPNPDAEKFKRANEMVSSALPKLLTWVGQLCNAAMLETAKELGKSIGRAAFWIPVGSGIIAIFERYSGALKAFAENVLRTSLGG